MGSERNNGDGVIAALPVEIQPVVTALYRGSVILLGSSLKGFYLHGSLALGDFNLRSSDIDFLALVDHQLTEGQFTAIEELHQQLNKKYDWGKRLEGSYLPMDALKHIKPPVEPRPYYNEGTLYWAEYGQEWILEKTVLREQGIVLWGASPTDLFPPIEGQMLHQAVVSLLQENWLPFLTDAGRLQEPVYQVYALLTMARSLYLLRQGGIVSKKQAAHWLMDTEGSQLKDALTEALGWVYGRPFDRMSESLELITYVLRQADEDKSQPAIIK